MMDDFSLETSEEVFIQTGSSDYIPKHAKYSKFLNEKQMERQISECRLMVSHAGIGSIIASLKNDKPIIIVPRKPEYNEIYDKHQMEICSELEHYHNASILWDGQDINTIIKSNPKMLNFSSKDILGLKIKQYIDSLERNDSSYSPFPNIKRQTIAKD